MRLHERSERGMTDNHGSFTVTVLRNTRMSLQLSEILFIALCAVADFSADLYLVSFFSSSLSVPIVPSLFYSLAADSKPHSNIFAANDSSIYAASVSPSRTIALASNSERRTAFSAAQSRSFLYL